MTSRLVGSEMCIRDRCIDEPAQAGGPQTQAALRQIDRPSNTQDEAGSVSYTHLTLPTICSV
eukprot:10322766-Prorocentrum_lima.AAC.1